jgi:hypothetical protein
MRLRRILAGLHFCLGALLFALLVFPIRSGMIRLLIAVSAGVFLVGLSMWVRNLRVRYGFLGILLLAGLAIAFLPAKSVDQARLRVHYVDALRRYEGDRYVWGGENGRGVDCSGIVRAAWIDSQWRLGIKTGNPQLIREAVSAWWSDASAKELSLGFGGRTRELHTAKSIRAHGDEKLSPGDFAIVAHGVHALAYLGDHAWIEADPGIGKVIVIPTNDKNAWLDSPAVFIRWRALE